MHHFDDNHPHARGWRKFEAFARRGFGGFPGAGFNWEGLEGNFRIGRMLASGDLRLVALYLIEQQPRHGYDLIKAVEDKTGGFYSPSPGIVYPALTFLEEAGYVTSTSEGNKKLYTITDEGRAHLASNRAAVESTLDYLGKIGRHWAEMRQGWQRREEAHGPGFVPGDIPGVIKEVNLARRALKDAIRRAAKGDEESQRRLAAILERAAREASELVDKPDGDIDV